jgi:hypothetical protein
VMCASRLLISCFRSLVSTRSGRQSGVEVHGSHVIAVGTTVGADEKVAEGTQVRQPRLQQGVFDRPRGDLTTRKRMRALPPLISCAQPCSWLTS